MIKKLSKLGNSFAILIDKPILDLLGIEETTRLKITTDGNVLIIEPIQEMSESELLSSDEKFREKYELLAAKYSVTLKKLSEN